VARAATQDPDRALHGGSSDLVERTRTVVMPTSRDGEVAEPDDRDGSGNANVGIAKPGQQSGRGMIRRRQHCGELKCCSTSCLAASTPAARCRHR